MAHWFESGQIVFFVLGVIAMEAMLLLRRTPHRWVDVVFQLGPGAFLLLAVYHALIRSAWPWVAAFLAASFPLHAADLWRRWRDVETR